MDEGLEITLNVAERRRRNERREENARLWQEHFKRQAVIFVSLAEEAAEKAEQYDEAKGA